jgi:hypothetical protein
MSDTDTKIGYNENDFFYNNVNSPLQLTSDINAICSLSDSELKTKIEAAFQIPVEIKSSSQPNARQGQCTWRKVQSGDTTVTTPVATSWSLEYTKDANGNINCHCKKNTVDKNGVMPYITNDRISIISNASPFFPKNSSPDSVNYTCVDSLPTTIQERQINDIQLDTTIQQNLINTTMKYYKEVCVNKRKATELIQSNSHNQDSDLKYEDAKQLYNREYLNRINLGVGILAICGLIYYTISSSSEPILPNSVPKPPST